MNDSVKEFLTDSKNPSILNEYYEDVYNYYCLQTIIKGKHIPVTKNKFSRDIGLWGFKTDVIRDHQEDGKCKRIIVLPQRILEYVIAGLKNNMEKRNVTIVERRNL
ncbi:MAG: hypothetical protein ACLUFU_03095 [Bacilli bacterium]